MWNPFQVLRLLLNDLKGTIVASMQELTAALQAATAELSATKAVLATVGTEIAALNTAVATLTAELAAGGGTTPEVDQALADLQAAAQGVSDAANADATAGAPAAPVPPAAP